MEIIPSKGSILGGIQQSPIITTKRRRSAAFKRKLLELIEQLGASVAGVALEHGVNANLVIKWRRAKHEHKRPAGTVLGDEGAGVKLAELAEAGEDGWAWQHERAYLLLPLKLLLNL